MPTPAAPVSVDLQAGVRSDLLWPLFLWLLIAGIVLLAIGVPLIVAGAMGLGRGLPAPPAGALQHTGPGHGSQGYRRRSPTPA